MVVEYNNETLWPAIRQHLKVSLQPHIFSTLVESLSVHSSNDRLELIFRDRFTKEGFEEKCLPTLKSHLKNISKENLSISLDVLESEIAAENYFSSISDQNPFDSKYTFETFVVGASNQFAHAACQAVSKQPGNCYNPLFIFGRAGLGKTHLLKAIGHELFNSENKPRILFLTSEAFTNELIQAIRLDRMREFREKYRNSCDVLLLDDIQFLADKERTQEEFYYTFNYLHESKKQIVITSDRYPKDIRGLEARLQTRFEWGLVADVQPPEIETRIAILQNKADEQKISLPDDVAAFIATHITTNIRELEGSLHRLQAHASLSGVPISLDLAQQTMKDIMPRMKHELSPDGILKLVAINFGLKISDLKSEKRARTLSEPRQICMYLLRKHLLVPFEEIGNILGGRHHTTVMHGVTEIYERAKSDPELESKITKIESLIR